MEKTHWGRQGMWEGTWCFGALSRHATLLAHPHGCKLEDL